MPKALLVLNPYSRQGQRDLSPALDLLRAQGFDLQELILEEGVDGTAAIQAAAAAGHVELVVVGGGDGTLNTTLPGVLRSGLPLGILPLGTANDLARTLALPTDPRRAAEVIAAGATRRIDIGQINDHFFFNVASLGVSAELAAEMDREQKARWGVLSYPIGLWRVVMRRRAFAALLRCDGRPRRVRAIQISIGNGRSYGGGMAIAADAAIDDGQLDVVVVAPQPVWRLILHLPLFRLGHHRLLSRVHHWRCRELELITRRALPINTDGEVTTRTPARLRVLPEALEVFLPPAQAQPGAAAAE
jgi:YegS/Rv2252/BmrU family lipid kinase